MPEPRVTATHLSPKDLALALAVILAWGLNFAVIKLGVRDVPPLLLGALRFVLVVFPAALFLKPPQVPLRWYIAFGLAAFFAQFAFLFSAIHVGMPSGLASLVLQSQSLFTLVLAGVWLKERWKAHHLVGLALAGAGLVAMGLGHGVSMPLAGFALTLLAALSLACGNIISRVVSRYGPMNQLAFVVWASVVPLLPFAAASWMVEGPQAIARAWAHFDGATLAAVVYLAWSATLLGYGIWTYLISRHPANRVAPFSMLVPLVALTAGDLMFDEALQTEHLVGGALLMAGLAVHVFGGSRLRGRTAA